MVLHRGVISSRNNFASHRITLAGRTIANCLANAKIIYRELKWIRPVD
jgi:predicted NodU family carbamoyl transferase